MRLYVEVARRGFRRYATYVGATVGGLFTNTIFGFFRAYVFIAVFAAAGPTIGGMDLRDALTYTFLTQSMIMTVGFWGWWEIAASIRTGDVVTDLFRPYDYQLWWLSMDLGRMAYQLLARGVLPLIVGALAFDLRFPERPVTWALLAVSVVLGSVVGFSIRFIANLMTFWVVDHRGPASMLTIAWTFLSGFVVPLSFFPDGWRELVSSLPFAATIQVPIDLFLERGTGTTAAGMLAFQAAWAAAMLGLSRLVLARAVRRVVTQGG